MTGDGTTPPAKNAEPLQAPLPGARTALILLLTINLFNYIDRQVLAAVLPPIATDFFPTMDTSSARAMLGLLGMLSTAFMVSYMVTAPIFGWLAERMSRWVLVGIGVILWSLASGATGLAPAGMFGLLLLTRCFVGIGEAAYGPAAPTIISDFYPVKRRGSVLAWFYMAIPVGGALGYVLGGMVAKLTGDWRWAFYLVVPPGLLLGVACFFIREPRRGQADKVDPALLESAGLKIESPGPSPSQVAPGEVAVRKGRLKDYLIFLRTPSYILNTLGMTAMTFAIGGFAFWMPYYIHKDRGQENLDHVNLIFGVIVVVSGLAATLLGGIAGDKLRPKFPGSYFLVSGAAMLLGFPMVIAMLHVDFPWAWFFVFAACFCLFFNTGPTNTILANVTHPSIRASGFALNILIIHALGDAISPPIIGQLAEMTSWKTSFMIVSLMILIGGLLWLWGARYLERDTALAPTRLGDGGSTNRR